ncbi:FKBP-type peptidyl-prolyl cis-trans isomerase [Candidatus Arsenophonus nilaparvatae]|uniref:FKBP-type peptidyl-prolyl cis-trans isomerase n=1 Tax=Candidatus Arsenophonus nilaparvatae TaxID=1247023 RepID=UPI000509F7DF|nr:FKBP-type peptidyl-prolyl cis-trans isomerase [Candidatus Arsenophonus nilaparvatae]
MLTLVQANSAVLLHFTIKLEDGSIADSTYNQDKPALFRLGDKSLSRALEKQLIGLSVGEKKTFTLGGEDVFGKPNPDMIQYFMPKDFIQVGIPEVGAIILFTTINGSEMPGIVTAVTEESIIVDFNHPLAAQNIIFNIEVLEIDPKWEESNANIAG